MRRQLSFSRKSVIERMARDSMKTGVFGDGVIKLAVP